MELLNEWLPIGTTLGEIGRGLLMGCFLSLLIVIAETWSRTLHPPVEWSRKFVHTTVVLTASFFPWFFDSYYAPLIAYGFLWCFMRVLKNYKMLEGLFKTKRKTKGDDFFFPTFYALYIICYDYPVNYLTAGIVLTFADTIAAIIGEHWGYYKYSVQEDWKSLEGSIGHFVSTFILVLLVFWGFADIGQNEALLLALLISLVSTAAEAVGPYGSDNLIVPFFIIYLCYAYINAPSDILVEQIIAFVLLLVILGIPSYLSASMGVGGLLVMHLIVYTSYSMNGLLWVVPILLVSLAFFLFFKIFRKMSRKQDIIEYGLHVGDVFVGMLIPSIVLLVSYVIGLYWEYTDAQSALVYTIFVASVALAGANGIGRANAYFRDVSQTSFTSLLIGSILSIPVALLGVYFVDSPMLTPVFCWIVVIGGIIPILQTFKKDKVENISQ